MDSTFPLPLPANGYAGPGTSVASLMKMPLSHTSPTDAVFLRQVSHMAICQPRAPSLSSYPLGPLTTNTMKEPLDTQMEHRQLVYHHRSARRLKGPLVPSGT